MLPPMLLIFTLSLSSLTCVLAQPATVPFNDCFSGNASQKLSVSNIYAQLLENNNGDAGARLNFTVLGTTPQEIIPSSNASDPVATTLFTTTNILTFEVWNNNSFFCSTLRPPSPLPNPDSHGSYCPLAAGPFALSTSITLPSGFELATFDTRLRALDPSQNELLCVDLSTTPLKPGVLGSVYGHAHAIFWFTVALAIAYWILVGLARLVSAWGRGSTRNPGFWPRVESAGFILASAISGERLAYSPALMRFCTPSLRDIVFHTQWCAALSMVAVQWPTFVYPLLSQTAWSTLSYNVTLTEAAGTTAHWNPLTVQPYEPPSNFVDQLDDPSSPIFVDSGASNLLFSLPSNAKPGIVSFAYAVGLRPHDLFGVCLVLFLAIMAATIALSMIVWCIDWIASLLSNSDDGTRSTPALAGTRSPRYSAGSKDLLEGISQFQTSDENRSLSSHNLFRTASRFPATRSWWRLRTRFVSFHGSVLQGNLVRILILFHLPVTIFSSYQMTMGRSDATLVSIILAGISFAVLSVTIPIFLILRLSFTPTTKLYDETWTLLSLGPLYNHYRHGSQLFAFLLFATNIAFGITIGCGQKSGTAQAIIILVVEVISALVTSVWLPWGHGASMGLISFLFCVARIVIAVLLVILTPIVSVGTGAAQWVAYAILFILALVYLAFSLMLMMKLVEALVRIFGGVGFHQSRRIVDSGLLGALGLAGCCGPRKSRHSKHSPYRPDAPKQSSALPLGRPTLPIRDTTPTHSGPPSVLRPEHALQPYKEESDDETGFIMGAWQPFPRPGYNTVDNQSPVPEPPKSGFARVGGGRAHYESPYAIASSSTQTFPSVERNMGTSPRRMSSADYSPPPTPSVASAARRADLNLPPGAMPPAHIRTKSQTAIIEDAAAVFHPVSMVQSADIQGDAEAEDGDFLTTQSKKKPWFTLRKSRRISEGDDDTQDAPPAEPEPGRSFVVVRKQRPGAPPAPSSGSSQPGQRSFAVLRGNNPD